MKKIGVILELEKLFYRINIWLSLSLSGLYGDNGILPAKLVLGKGKILFERRESRFFLLRVKTWRKGK